MERQRGPANTSPGSSCGVCGGTGFVQALDAVGRCECRKQRVIHAKLADIPERFRSSSFANYIPVDARQDSALEQVAGDFTGSFFLFGDYARGKTHLATAQYVKLIQIERPCMFLCMAELISELRRSEMDPDYFCTVRMRARYAEQFHLFIDDIDKFKATDFKFEVLFDLFDTLYRRKLGLTATSNYSLRELATTQTLHPAIVRRIDDTCRAVEI